MTTEKEPLLLRAARLLDLQASLMPYTGLKWSVAEQEMYRNTAAELRAMHERMKDDQKPG